MCVCVCLLTTQVAQIITAARIETCNTACGSVYPVDIYPTIFPLTLFATPHSLRPDICPQTIHAGHFLPEDYSLVIVAGHFPSQLRPGQLNVTAHGLIYIISNYITNTNSKLNPMYLLTLLGNAGYDTHGYEKAE